MIDGIKIEVPTTTAKQWLNCRLLNFYTGISKQTGVLMDNTEIATSKGLVFIIRYKDEAQKHVSYCEVKGSLHKFYNGGKHNANDFSLIELETVLNTLEHDYHIEKNTAQIRNLEFGFNINTPISSKAILKNLVAYKNYEFNTLSVATKKVGKQIGQQQQRFKIYDKGKEHNLNVDNLTRFEVAFKKMIVLKPYGITYLSDLLNIDKIRPLVGVLLDWWDNVIYYDKSIDITHLTHSMQKRVLYYATPRNWSDYNRKQRLRAKKRYKSLMDKYGSNTQFDIKQLILEKWENLTAEKWVRINRLSKENQQHKNGYELTVRINGLNVPKTPLNQNIKKGAKLPIKKQIKRNRCKTCKTDISHKRKTAMFCSKKCNNSFHGYKRTKKRRQERAKQKKDLENLIRLIPKKQMSLIVYYKSEGVIYSDALYQIEIRTSKEWIRTIKKIEVSEYRKNGKVIVLTSYRARRLIKLINLENK